MDKDDKGSQKESQEGSHKGSREERDVFDKVEEELERFPPESTGSIHSLRDNEVTPQPSRPIQPPLLPRAHPWPEQGHRSRRPYVSGPKDQQPMSILWPTSLFIMVLLLAIILAAVTRTDNAEAQPKTAPDLEIEEGMVFFQLDDIDNGSYRMTISVYITNYGEETSGDIRMNIYAENKFNDIVYDSANKTVEAIEGHKTIEVTIPIELPENNSFRIRIFLFEAGLIKIHGYGEVSLTNVDQTVVEYTDDNSAGRGPTSEDMSASDPLSIGASLIIIGLVAAAILTRRVSGGSDQVIGRMKV